ncbi:unnamed protein product [Mycena citricolor]|uniref:Uncharacterized protein n=1 Tax=Mycena citricolor TaxID=2018698 RepID=A0AAD2K7R8_9AGAR|nr:unnamed protein product [Mycena citricolor]
MPPWGPRISLRFCSQSRGLGCSSRWGVEEVLAAHSKYKCNRLPYPPLLDRLSLFLGYSA